MGACSSKKSVTTDRSVVSCASVGALATSETATNDKPTEAKSVAGPVEKPTTEKDGAADEPKPEDAVQVKKEIHFRFTRGDIM